MTLKSGTSQACAACKYQRRKCTPECQLAPYFPPDKPKIFLNAHKLFGVSNILKILKHLDPSQKTEAMTSIIYQSNVRDKFPVLGCVGVIQHYMNQIRQCEHQLQMIHSLLAFSQQQQQQQPTQPNSLDKLQLGIAPFHSSPPPSTTPAPFAISYGAHENYSYSSCWSNTFNSAYLESSNENASMNPPLWIQQTNDLFDHNSTGPSKGGEQVIHEYDEMRSFFGAKIMDKQSYVDSKKAYDSSPESSMTDTMQSIDVSDNELKTAAACFSLTSVK